MFRNNVLGVFSEHSIRMWESQIDQYPWRANLVAADDTLGGLYGNFLLLEGMNWKTRYFRYAAKMPDNWYLKDLSFSL